MNNDNLLAQATCAVLIDNEIVGTAWLVSNEGYLLTAGHVLGKDEPCDEVDVRFTGKENSTHKAYKIAWHFQPEEGVDFAVLKLSDSLIDCQPLPISLAESVSGRFRLRGYGKNLPYQSSGIAEYVASYDCKESSENRLFQLDSRQLSVEGYSGGALFSDDLKAVVAIQIEATRSRIGAGRDTILAMPMYRIAERWPLLYDMAKESPIGSPQIGYEPPAFPESVYNFENRTQDIPKVFSFLKSNPYLHLYGPSGIGKTFLAVQLLKERYNENNKAYLDFNERKFQSQSRSIESLLREVQQQLYNTDVIVDLSLNQLITNLADNAKENSGYGIVILDNVDRIAPTVRRQLREEILPPLERQIADPKRYLRIIAIAQTQLPELRGSAKSIYFQPYFLAEFGEMKHDLPTYKDLLMQAVKRFADGLLDRDKTDDDNLLREWAYTLYDLTGGHPGAIEGILNHIGDRKLFAKLNVFEQQREAICKSVLAPLIEQQVQGCLPNPNPNSNPNYQQAFRQLWIFRYLSKGVFRQVLRTVKDKAHWSDLNAITRPVDYDPKYAPLWQRLIETPLLQSEDIDRSRFLSHQLSPIWRKQGNLILQVVSPSLYQTLHRDAFAIFDHFATGQTTRNLNMRISCFVEALYHLTQQKKISASAQNRSYFTKEFLDYVYILIHSLEYEEEFLNENLYQVKKLLESDEELQAQLNKVGTQDTYQQISHIISQKINN